MSLRVLHIVSSNRWSGAAAPAFAEVEALRSAGVDAHYAYVGGYKLERKIGVRDFAHPIIDRDQNPLSFLRSLRRVRRLVREHRFNVIHAHLTYDHWIAHFVSRKSHLIAARTFHSRRAIRNDFITREFIASSRILCAINADLVSVPPLHRREVIFTPPPVDTSEFTPQGADARALYGIARDEKVLCAIGKLTDDRNFEDALATFAIARRSNERMRLLIIGNGPHKEALQAKAQELGIGAHVVWAGYHQTDLPEHYRAADGLLFTSRGSDEGHRAVLEAMACGVPPASYPLEGISGLTGDLTPALVSGQPDAESLAARVTELLGSNHAAFREAVVRRSHEFAYDRAAGRLISAYEKSASHSEARAKLQL